MYVSDLAHKLTALKIPAFSIRPIESALFTEYHIQFRDDITISKVRARLADLELFFDSPVEMSTSGGCIVFKIQNKERLTESTFDYMNPDILQNGNDYILPVAIGHDSNGKRIYFDLTKAPHILAGGSTGSGKSVFLNNCIMSLIFGAKSALCLIDVKRVEFSIYEDIPNLAWPVAYTTKDAKTLLKNLCYTMDSRYQKLKAFSCRSIQDYNQNRLDKMQYITVVIDEIADLFMQDKTIQPLVIRLAQLGRAAGVHLILATQRPDSTVVNGLIRANVPTRVCFAVQKATDSRIILDEGGGEKLKGAGDGLFKPIGSRTGTRFQSPYITTPEIMRVIDRLKAV